jgi:hypothetical protein
VRQEWEAGSSTPDKIHSLTLIQPAHFGLTRGDVMNAERFRMSRRHIAGLSILTLGGLLIPAAHAQQRALDKTVGVGVSAPSMKDEDIFTFALNLEYMEAEFYLRSQWQGYQRCRAGTEAGRVTGGHEAKFERKEIREFEELTENELAHVRFYRKTLGRSAVSRPAIDFDAGFKAAAQAAGLPPDFEPFADDMSVLLGGMLFEMWASPPMPGRRR